MEQELLIQVLLYTAIGWIFFHFIITAINRSKLNPNRLPPGPFPLPLVGNMFSIGFEPLKALNELPKLYGPIMSLQIGYGRGQTTVIVTSALIAKEILLTNDASFANRHLPDSFTAVDHHKFNMGLLPANAKWKLHRKLFNSHVLSNSRLDSTQLIWKKNVEDLLSYVETCSKREEAVKVNETAYMICFNFLLITCFSDDLGIPNSEIASEIKILLKDLLRQCAIPNLSDAYPILKRLDPQRIKKRTVAVTEKLITIFSNMISERLKEMELHTSVKKNDVLDTYLSLVQESKEIQLSEVPHLLLEIFTAGVQTTATTLEWAMTELIRNPEKMKKAQAELRNIIQKHNPVLEKDISQLPYLQSVVKETFRLHPPAPFLFPRTVYKDTKLGNFTVPKNAQILIMLNTIQKDWTIWKNPELFEPERFLMSSIDFKGQNFEFFPFGSGRRICPGLPLASRMVHSMLGSLIHGFDWKVEDGVTPPNTLNMEEKLGYNLSKAEPLLVIPVSK